MHNSLKGGEHVGKQLKELCPSKLAQFLAVQGGVLMLLSQIAFCSDASLAYANVRRELQLFIHAIADTGITIAAFVGILAFIVFISSSNEKTAETGKSWAKRAAAAIALFLFLRSSLGVGLMDSIINGLLS